MKSFSGSISPLVETSPAPLRVMHIIDSLRPGGAEMMSINLCNEFSKAGNELHLCVSREDGKLRSRLSPDVKFFLLNRRSRMDIAAILRLVAYIREHKIQVLHAHTTSIFIAAIAGIFLPSVRIIWHNHAGEYIRRTEGLGALRLLASRAAKTIVVNEQLRDWSIRYLNIPASKLCYLHNFVEIPETAPKPLADLRGSLDYRLVCVANLRREKNHLTLLKALAVLKNDFPQLHLLLVGNFHDESYVNEIKALIEAEKLESHVSLLGQRSDVREILASAVIGVLSSDLEGLPLSLLEYGAMGLAVVATDVGQCRAVLGDGAFGYLVQAGDWQAMAEKLAELLGDKQKREALGKAFHQHIIEEYAAEKISRQLRDIYQTVLSH